MFIKINNSGQDLFLNTDNILYVNKVGTYYELTFILGTTMRISVAEAQVIIPLLPTANNTPLSI